MVGVGPWLRVKKQSVEVSRSSWRIGQEAELSPSGSWTRRRPVVMTLQERVGRGPNGRRDALDGQAPAAPRGCHAPASGRSGREIPPELPHPPGAGLPALRPGGESVVVVGEPDESWRRSGKRARDRK